MARTRKPSASGSVTATMRMASERSSRATRWRTAPSDSPTAVADAPVARGGRPSCSCAMIARSALIEIRSHVEARGYGFRRLIRQHPPAENVDIAHEHPPEFHRPRRIARARARRLVRGLRRRQGHRREGRAPAAGGREPPEGARSATGRSPTGRSTSTRRSSRSSTSSTAASQVHRGHQRQLRVLRQGPPAAEQRPADRPRHRDADRLHGRALDPQRLRRADRQEERPELRRTSSTTSRRSTTTPSASTRCRGSRAPRASATTSRRPAASSRASRTSSTRSSRAA